MAFCVLIVEDDVNINSLLREILSIEGFDVQAAFDGEEALHKIAASAPSALVLDLGLPKLSGLEVLKRLKEDPKTKAIPVIIHSALSQPEDIQRGLEMGAAKYLTKPCPPPEIIEALRQALKIEDQEP
ncbi:MAG: response regulator [Elusimicrobia bacterium]|nr:response regulator [Elusimicrobiota bacterium]